MALPNYPMAAPPVVNSPVAPQQPMGGDEMSPELLQMMMSLGEHDPRRRILDKKMAEAAALRGSQVQAPNGLAALATVVENYRGRQMDREAEKESGLLSADESKAKQGFITEYLKRGKKPKQVNATNDLLDALTMQDAGNAGGN